MVNKYKIIHVPPQNDSCFPSFLWKTRPEKNISKQTRGSYQIIKPKTKMQFGQSREEGSKSPQKGAMHKLSSFQKYFQKKKKMCCREQV